MPANEKDHKSDYQQNGSTLVDLLLRIFNLKLLLILGCLALVAFIGLNVYAFFEGKRGREVKTFFYSVGEDPYLAANVQATCSALLPTQTSILHQNPTATAEPILIDGTETREANPYSLYDFQEGCIPTFDSNNPSEQIWSIFPTLLSVNQDPCLKTSYKLGFIPHNEELEIFVDNQPKEYYQGLKIEIPMESTSISFEVNFSDLSTSIPTYASRFFYGFIDKEKDSNLSGKFIIYVNKQDDSIGYLKGADPKELYVDTPIEINNQHQVFIDLSKPNYMTVQIDGIIPDALKNIPIPARTFIIGYYVPTSGTIEMHINDFKILPD